MFELLILTNSFIFLFLGVGRITETLSFSLPLSDSSDEVMREITDSSSDDETMS